MAAAGALYAACLPHCVARALVNNPTKPACLSLDAAIVNAVINLGVSLGMDIVAEGIETQAQASYLLRQGCAVGQGYLFGRAAPPEMIPALISTWIPPIVLPTGSQS